MTAFDNLAISIVEHRAPAGGTSVFMEFHRREDGPIVLDGQDIGQAPEEFFGDSDYEYWTVVAPEQKDRLVLALLAEKYQGDFMATSKFRDWLEANNIPYEGGSY